MDVVEPDGSVPVAVADLPREVRASLDARVVQSELLDVELTVLDGQLLYRFTGATGDQSFELTLTPQGDAVAPEAAAGHTHVKVLDFDLIAADPGDIQIKTADLPPAVVAAIYSRFPRARLVDAEFSTADGAPEYSVSAHFGTHAINLALTPSGDITEVEQALTSTQVPPSVLNWVKQYFADGTVDEVTAVTDPTGLGYQVVIGREGHEEFEATLRVQGAQAPNNLLGQFSNTPGREQSSRVSLNTAGGSRSIIGERTAGLNQGVEQAPSRSESDASNSPSAVSELLTDPAESAQPVPDLAPQSRNAPPMLDEEWDGAQLEAGRSALWQNLAWTSIRAPLLVEFAPPLMDAAGLAGPLPEIANTINFGLSAQMAGVEQKLHEFLGKIDSLTDQSAPEEALGSDRLRLAVLTVFAICARLLMVDFRRRKRRTALMLGAGAPSWSWVLGAVRPARPRDGMHRS